jgi:hypothetical protein
MSNLQPKIEAGIKSHSEKDSQQKLLSLFQKNTILEEEALDNLHVFLKRQKLSRILFLNEIYQQILPLPGIIVQCGVRWGGDLVTLLSLRGIYEPYNYSRRILGFDTFSGLKGCTEKDQGSWVVADGQYNVVANYAETLAEILAAHEGLAPLSHIPKHELFIGDVMDTLPKFEECYPGEQIALLYLDMDIYQPTKFVLERSIERLMPGSIVVFDEFGDRRFPGEAQAYRELAARCHLQMQRSPLSTVTAYGIVSP